LRVYIMHAGWPMLDDLLAVLWAHPQVHVDVGIICYALPRKEFHRYVERIVEAGVWQSHHVRVGPNELAGSDRAWCRRDRIGHVPRADTEARHFVQQCRQIPTVHAGPDRQASRSIDADGDARSAKSFWWIGAVLFGPFGRA